MFFDLSHGSAVLFGTCPPGKARKLSRFTISVTTFIILTPEKAEKIAKANEHIKKGENKKAVEILRDAGVYLNLTAAFLPLEATTSAIEKAAKLIGENKYYEANLVLKGIEDSVTVDSQTFIEWLEAMPGPTKKG